MGENGMPVQSHGGGYLFRLTDLLCNSFLSAGLMVTIVYIFILAKCQITAWKRPSGKFLIGQH